MAVSEMAERFAIRYVLDNRLAVIRLAFPCVGSCEHDIGGVCSKFTIKYFTTISDNRVRKIGYIQPSKSNRGRPKLHGWHGDYVIFVNCPKLGKRAIIFEVKYGNIHLSDSQIEFFTNITANPTVGRVKKISMVKVFIVHCNKLDLKNRTMEMEFIDFSENREYLIDVTNRTRQGFKSGDMGQATRINIECYCGVGSANCNRNGECKSTDPSSGDFHICPELIIKRVV